jgi:hypothetical protein
MAIATALHSIIVVRILMGLSFFGAAARGVRQLVSLFAASM